MVGIATQSCKMESLGLSLGTNHRRGMTRVHPVNHPATTLKSWLDAVGFITVTWPIILLCPVLMAMLYFFFYY